MEINNENKVKFFGLYWGQAYMYKNEFGKFSDKVGGYNFNKHIQSAYLMLKPLSSISDEDAIEVIKLCEGYVPSSIEFRDRTADSFASPEKWRQAYNLLYPGTKEERTDIIANFSDTKDGITICNGNEYWRCHTRTLDYLRSKGYALPWMGLSVEQMIEVGWIKLTT